MLQTKEKQVQKFRNENQLDFLQEMVSQCVYSEMFPTEGFESPSDYKVEIELWKNKVGNKGTN